MQSKLSGLARKWFSGLTTINPSWVTWKEKLIKAFPEGFDYDIMLKAMINRVKKPQESMTEYYYEKTLFLSRLGISGKNAVSCVIGGLNSMSQREGTLCNPPPPVPIVKINNIRVIGLATGQSTKISQEATRSFSAGWN